MKLILGGVICIIICFAAFYLYYVNTKYDSVKKNWPITEATILHSAVVEDNYDGSTGGPTNRKILNPIWRVAITYSFTINGKTYKGNQLSNTNSGIEKRNSETPPGKLTQITSQLYPQGSTVNIYYNINNPTESFIEYSPKEELIWVLMVGILFLALGASLFTIQIRS